MARNLGSAVVHITANVGGLARGVGQANGLLGGIGSGVGRSPLVGAAKFLTGIPSMVGAAGQSIQRAGMKTTAAGLAVSYTMARALKKGVGTYATIEKGLEIARSVAGAAKKDWQPVIDSVRKLGIESQFMQVDIADAAKTIAQAGITGPQDIDRIMTHAVDLATVLDVDLPDAVGKTISAAESMSFGRIGGKFSDQNLRRVVNNLTDIQGAARVDAHDLQFFNYQIAGLMSTFKKDPRELLAAFGATNQVMNNGRIAATGLRQGLEKLPLIALRGDSKRAAEHLRKFGYTLAELDPRKNNIAEIADIMERTGMTKDPLFQRWLGTRGARVFWVLGKQLKLYKQIQARMDKMRSASDRAADILNTIDGLIIKIKSSLEAVWQEVGAAMEAIGMRQLFQSVLDFVNGGVLVWMGENRKLVGTILMAVTALGVFLSVVGIALFLFGGFLTASAAIANVLMFLLPLFALWGGFTGRLGKAWARFKKEFELEKSGILPSLRYVFDIIKKIWGAMKSGDAGEVKKQFNVLGSAVQFLFLKIKKHASRAGEILKAKLKNAFDEAKKKAGDFFGDLKNLVKKFEKVMSFLSDEAIPWLKNNKELATILTTLAVLLPAILGVVGAFGVAGQGVSMLGGAITFLSGLFLGLGRGVFSVIALVGGLLGRVFLAVFGAVWTVVARVGSLLFTLGKIMLGLFRLAPWPLLWAIALLIGAFVFLYKRVKENKDAIAEWLQALKNDPLAVLKELARSYGNWLWDASWWPAKALWKSIKWLYEKTKKLVSEYSKWVWEMSWAPLNFVKNVASGLAGSNDGGDASTRVARMRSQIGQRNPAAQARHEMLRGLKMDFNVQTPLDAEEMYRKVGNKMQTVLAGG